MPTGAGKGDVDISFGVERGVRDRVEVVGDRNRDLDLVGIADVVIGRHHHRAGGCAFGNAGDQELVGTDQHRPLDFSELYTGAAQFGWTQPFT